MAGSQSAIGAIKARAEKEYDLHLLPWTSIAARLDVGNEKVRSYSFLWSTVGNIVYLFYVLSGARITCVEYIGRVLRGITEVYWPCLGQLQRRGSLCLSHVELFRSPTLYLKVTACLLIKREKQQSSKLKDLLKHGTKESFVGCAP